MKIKKGDKVLIISGKSRGKQGKVLQVFPERERIVVEGANIGKRHTKPRQQGEKGQTVERPMPLHVSNAKLICPKCNVPARIGYRVNIAKDEKGSRVKVRICKKCGSEV